MTLSVCHSLNNSVLLSVRYKLTDVLISASSEHCRAVVDKDKDKDIGSDFVTFVTYSDTVDYS